MDRWKSEWFRISSSLGRGLEAKRVNSLKDDSQVAIVRSVLNLLASIAQKFKSEYNAKKLRLLYSSHYTWGISTLGWEGESILAFDSSLAKKAWSWPWDPSLKRKPSLLALRCVRCRKECWLPLSPPWTFSSSWQNLLLGLVKPNFINLTTHCLTYYSRKQGLNNWPILLLFYCSLIHLFKSSHLF